MIQQEFKSYDVWATITNGRVAYRALPAIPADAPRPDWAAAHISTVEAVSKRAAIKAAVREMRRLSD